MTPPPFFFFFFFTNIQTEHAAKTSSQVSHERLLNEYRQKNKVALRAVKWPRLAPNYSTRYICTLHANACVVVLSQALEMHLIKFV